jgi:hypothetical protein
MVDTMALASVVKRGFPLYSYTTLGAPIGLPYELQLTTPNTVGGNIYAYYDVDVASIDTNTNIVTPILSNLTLSNAGGMTFFTIDNSAKGGILADYLIVNTGLVFYVSQTSNDSNGKIIYTAPYTLTNGISNIAAPTLASLAVTNRYTIIGEPAVFPSLVSQGGGVNLLSVDSNGTLIAGNTNIVNSNLGRGLYSPTTNNYYYLSNVPPARIYLAGSSLTSNIILPNTNPIGYTIVPPPTGDDIYTIVDITFDPYGNLWISGQILDQGTSTTVYVLSKYVFTNLSNGSVTYTTQLLSEPYRGLVILDASGNGYYSGSTGVLMTRPYYSY